MGWSCEAVRPRPQSQLPYNHVSSHMRPNTIKVTLSSCCIRVSLASLASGRAQNYFPLRGKTLVQQAAPWMHQPPQILLPKLKGGQGRKFKSRVFLLLALLPSDTKRAASLTLPTRRRLSARPNYALRFTHINVLFVCHGA